MTTTLWGIHNNVLAQELVDGNFVSIGWELPDLKTLPATRDGIKRVLAEMLPESKPQSIISQAGVIYRFVHEMKIGDIVISPNKFDSTINIGIIEGDYYFQEDASQHRHRRPVRWVKTDISRAVFTQSALYELGSAITLFQVKRHAHEIMAVLNAETDNADEMAERVEELHSGGAEQPTNMKSLAVSAKAQESETTDTEVPEQPRASRILRHTKDFILDTIARRISPQEFEELCAELMRALGYQARVTRYSQDGGIDVIAHKDPLGIEPPLIKGQCKQQVANIGAPAVQQLVGTQGEGELSVFFTTAAYSRDALAIERQRPGLRLLSGEDIVELIMENYECLPEEWRREIPLTPVLVVSDQAE